MKSLSRKMLTQFAACIAVLLLLATPLFYFLLTSSMRHPEIILK